VEELGKTSKVLEFFKQINSHKKSFFMMGDFIYFCMVTWDVYWKGHFAYSFMKCEHILKMDTNLVGTCSYLRNS